MTYYSPFNMSDKDCEQIERERVRCNNLGDV